MESFDVGFPVTWFDADEVKDYGLSEAEYNDQIRERGVEAMACEFLDAAGFEGSDLIWQGNSLHPYENVNTEKGTITEFYRTGSVVMSVVENVGAYRLG